MVTARLAEILGVKTSCSLKICNDVIITIINLRWKLQRNVRTSARTEDLIAVFCTILFFPHLMRMKPKSVLGLSLEFYER